MNDPVSSAGLGAPWGTAGAAGARARSIDPVQQAQFIRRLKIFQERLLNIDLRNPSLFLRRIVKKRSLDLATLPLEMRSEIQAQAARQKGATLLVAERDLSDSAEALRLHCTALGRQSDALTEETGLQELFVGLCWLDGNITRDIFLRGPLLLIPVRLEHQTLGRRAGWSLDFETTRQVQTNGALLAALRKHGRWEAPEDLQERLDGALEAAAAADPFDPQVSFGALTKTLREAGLPFDAEQYAPELKINPLTSAAVQAQGVQPLQLASYQVLGLFPQASTALYLDYEEMIARAEGGETNQGVVDNLLDAPAQSGIAPAVSPVVALDEVSETRLNTVLPSDPSQEAILIKAQSAECVVVRGPPGTGKSQVIVNLVADGLSRGERILVVCQKRAALDVVFERMSRIGLGGAAFLVHDSTADRAATYRKMAQVLASAVTDGSTNGLKDTPAPAATAADGVQVSPVAAPGAAGARAQANTGAMAAAIDRQIVELRAIVEPLGRDFHGLPLSRLYGRARPGFKPVLELTPLDTALAEAALREFMQIAEAAKPGVLQFDQPGTPLAGRRNWAQAGHVERSRWADEFARLAASAKVAAPCVRVADSALRAQLAERARRFEQLRTRWYRVLLPGWHAVRGFVTAHQQRMRLLSTAEWPDALERAAELESALSKLAAAMDTPWLDRAAQLIDDPLHLENLAREVTACIARDFEAVQRHDRIRARLTKPQERVLVECARVLDQATAWSEHLLHEFNLRWIDEAETAHPALRGKPFERYETLRRNLAEQLDHKRDAMVQQVVQTVADRQTTPSFPPGFQPKGNRKAQTDWNKLAHEVGKKRYIKPLRVLLKEFDWPVRQVAPCWLASPEAVSEIFPLERHLFDRVIFDEASQLDVERALPVLYRARRVVVAGDENQMPPSHFFEATADDSEAAVDDAAVAAEAAEATRAVAQVESLLLLAKRMYGFDYLGWHYRSEFQELIDFSNHAFYDGRLTVAANLAQPVRPPITWHAVAGVWEQRRNAVEAKAAVDLLALELKAAHAGAFHSVGIITFNEAQQEEIKDVIERRIAVDAAFAGDWAWAQQPVSGKVDDKPFVKNIENVQGDERDVILFSVGYGPDPAGAFRRQFGPLSVDGGENRLNVAVTRARRAMRVVCSFDPRQLDVSDAKNLGPRRFQQFLCYAQAVSAQDGQARGRQVQAVLESAGGRGATGEAGQVPSAFAGEPSPFEAELQRRLGAAGLTLEPHWGAGTYTIDLAVVDPADPTRFCLGIEVDGAMYHTGRSVRERDVARRRFLEQRGWKLTRVWSRDWWLDADGEMKRILALIPNRPAKP